ncbi:DedA family protein [Pseudogemmobacter faecipullorum]|uniref:DedA family protein n=1 Tax=Pseudogemmobacter faecipullorum TaxID=2755041 RepID=A0ABS8CKQ3_9RHOB|nr:DedA family protein [Pseudogemmobacter faecipullorum]MCB5409738.1 DedA family protein [Pseudogemmobacter faecipullorum]
MTDLIEQVIAFVERHHLLAPWLMLIFAAAETTAFLSILVPSTAIMVGVGAFAANGVLNFTTLWLGASAGALAGSTFSFWLGRRYGDAILKCRPLSDHPDWVVKADAAFTRWGPLTVLLGHFTTFLRPVVFLMAGMSGMNFLRFAFWNGIGCLSWAFVVLKFGEVGGIVISWIWAHLFG